MVLCKKAVFFDFMKKRYSQALSIFAKSSILDAYFDFLLAKNFIKNFA